MLRPGLMLTTVLAIAATSALAEATLEVVQQRTFEEPIRSVVGDLRDPAGVFVGGQILWLNPDWTTSEVTPLDEDAHYVDSSPGGTFYAVQTSGYESPARTRLYRRPHEYICRLTPQSRVWISNDGHVAAGTVFTPSGPCQVTVWLPPPGAVLRWETNRAFAHMEGALAPDGSRFVFWGGGLGPPGSPPVLEVYEPVTRRHWSVALRGHEMALGYGIDVCLLEDGSMRAAIDMRLRDGRWLVRLMRLRQTGMAEWGEPQEFEGLMHHASPLLCSPDGSLATVTLVRPKWALVALDRLLRPLWEFTPKQLAPAEWALGEGEGLVMGMAVSRHGRVAACVADGDDDARRSQIVLLSSEGVVEARFPLRPEWLARHDALGAMHPSQVAFSRDGRRLNLQFESSLIQLAVD